MHCFSSSTLLSTRLVDTLLVDAADIVQWLNVGTAPKLNYVVGSVFESAVRQLLTNGCVCELV